MNQFAWIMELTRKRVILIVAALIVLAAVVYGFWPDATAVQVATVERDSLQVIVEEEGETRVTDRYVVSSPIAAFARRIEVEAGDVVAQGDPLVRIEAPRANLLDPRMRAEAEAAVEQAERQAEAAEAAAGRARGERQRVERLVEQGSATQQALEQAVAEAQQAEANLAAARAAVTRARAALYDALEDDTEPVRDMLRAPAAGRVLTVHRRSAGAVNPGEPLVEVGDTEALEVHVDVLSQDAVRITPGTPLRLGQWGGDRMLEAVVDRVEPQGQTTVSALGVEEQRVTVVANLVSPPDAWAGLGSGYRVLARFIVWEGDDVLQVPTSALFRTDDDGWAAFVVEGDVARRRAVRVGHQSGLAAQVLSGLEAGETVIVHPNNDLEDGMRVEPRDA